MATGIVALKSDRKKGSELLALAGTVKKGFMDNSILFPNPFPTLQTLTSAQNALQAALQAWGEKGNRGKHSDWLKLQDEIKNMRTILKSLANYAQNITTDRTTLALIGWDLKGAKSPSIRLSQVIALKQDFPKGLSRRFLKLKWKRPLSTKRGDVKNYLIYRSETNVFSDAEIIDTVTKTSFIDMDPGIGINYYWVVPCNTLGAGEEAIVVASTSPIV